MATLIATGGSGTSARQGEVSMQVTLAREISALLDRGRGAHRRGLENRSPIVPTRFWHD
jgi:hypothetical protein